MYQLREALIDELEWFNIFYSGDRKLFKILTILDFESFCVQEEKLGDTDTTTWTSKHVPLSVWILSNVIENAKFLCISNPSPLVESFLDDLDGLVTQSKTQTKIQLLEMNTGVKTKLNKIFSAFN